jgi:chorismate mutase/prephenate dehydratase
MNSAENDPNHCSSEAIHDRLRELDTRILELLAERIAALADLSPSQVNTKQLTELASRFGSVAPKEQLVELLQHVSSLSGRQAWLSRPVAYLGPVYSYSYLAAVKYFGLGAELVPVASISAAFDEVVRKQAAFAVVPIENSTDGRIVDTLGVFHRCPVKICGEVLLPVHHCLLGSRDRSTIQEVHSKPQALSQCRGWLAQHLPEAKLVEVSSTATAAAAAAASDTIAAIASREAGVHYGCRVIAENIEDNSQNVTRFAIIGDHPCPPTGNDKTSLMFELHHQPGALADAMMVFKSSGVNLTWIESFPMPNRPNEYMFFIELDGHQASRSVEAAIETLGQMSQRMEILGSYSKGELTKTK